MPALADSLDDDLNTAWESIWDERGTPARVTRWARPVLFRIVGGEAARLRSTVIGALTAAGEASGVHMTETSDPLADLEIEVAAEGELDDNVGCLTQSTTLGHSLDHVRIRMRASMAWECLYHEVMHAMGIPGHPTGKTVLSYFPWRRDRLLPMDRMLLAAWYDRALTGGATPFEFLLVVGRHVATSGDHGVPPEPAEQRRRLHFEARLADMERYARGEGDVPLVIRRSNRASGGHIEAGRELMAQYLGLAYQRGTGVVKDEARAAAWFAQGRAAASPPASRARSIAAPERGRDPPSARTQSRGPPQRR